MVAHFLLRSARMKPLDPHEDALRPFTTDTGDPCETFEMDEGYEADDEDEEPPPRPTHSPT